MPSKTKKQRRTMAAAAHDPKFARKLGIPQGVAKEFNEADAKGAEAGGKKRMKKLKRKFQKKEGG